LLVAGALSGIGAAGGDARDQRTRQVRLVLTKEAAVAAIASTGRYLTWERAPSQGHSISTLVDRDSVGGKVRRLASGPLPEYGLASTSGRVVYARQGNAGIELIAVRHDGSDPFILARSLAAPIASRGELIAWAEQRRSVQRVLVRYMSSGHTWVALRIPRCRKDRCYRIDRVALADRGVVVSRGAVGSHPSLIVRRQFGSVRPEVVAVPRDPQPDLAASSAGALYFWFRHGWARWDFGQRKPHLISPRDVRPWLLEYRHGRFLLLAGSRCRPQLVVRLPGRRSFVVGAPASTPASPRDLGPLCRQLTGFVWQERRLLVSWSVIPKVSVDAHSDAGLVGVVTASVLPKR
jgi:hypothetical protein